VGLGIRSHCVQKSQTPVRSGSLDFLQAIPNLVAKAVGTMCRAHSAFEAFDDSDRNRTHFIEIRVFHRCGKFLVPWPCGVEPELA
jgi:hypothetical protein